MGTAKKTEKTDGGAKDRPWEPRLWNGMTMKPWFGLLKRNRFDVAPSRIPMATINSGLSVINSGLALMQKLTYGRRIANCKIAEDPIFILGHWRTGTTWLHELMVLDDRHAYPTTYQCIAPAHFLFSAPLTRWWLWMLLPRKRPMDNVRISLDTPQEDELALCALGARSPYATWAFPNHPPQDQEYLDLRNVPPDELERWKHTFQTFLATLQIKNPGKRIVLKSPTHTFRVPVLLDMFPNARFVYLVRDPFVVFPSMIKTWKRMHSYHGAQVPKHEGLEQYVLDTFEHLDRVFEEDRQLIDPTRLCVMRYEDLVADPITETERIYTKLDLGEFERVRPKLQEYVAGLSDYTPNRHDLPDELQDRIEKQWSGYIDRYGYTRRRQQETTARESG